MDRQNAIAGELFCFRDFLKLISQALAWSLLPLLLQSVTGSPQNDRVKDGMKRHGGQSDSHAHSNNVYQTKFDGVTWDEDNWLLTTSKCQPGQYESRGSVANGYLGINVASVGPFFEVDKPGVGDVISGWPLFSRRQSFATIAGFYDFQPTTNASNFPWLYQYTGESVISGVPHWSGLILDLGDGTYLDSTVDQETISNFQSTFDYQSGLLSWSYRWTPNGDKGAFDINYRLFVNKLHVNQAVVDMEIVPLADSEGSVVNVLDGFAAVRADYVDSGEDGGAIYSAVSPWGLPDIKAYIYADLTGSKNVDLSSRQFVCDEKPYISGNESSIAESVAVKFRAHEPVRITKFVGGASSDAFDNPKETAKHAAAAAKDAGYAKSLRDHVSEWATVMPKNSVDRFTYSENNTLPAEQHTIDSAVIAVTNTYYLLQTTVGKNAAKLVPDAPMNVDSMSVGGLTSDSYAGLVFWDADVWMQPGLVTSHPEASQRFTNFRLAKYPQAQENLKTSYAGSQNDTHFDPSGAIYPWTSGRWGNCTATGPCWDYEYHLNGDIGLSLINELVASGDVENFKKNHFPIYDSVATLYSDLLEPNGTAWTLKNMTDPVCSCSLVTSNSR